MDLNQARVRCPIPVFRVQAKARDTLAAQCPACTAQGCRPISRYHLPATLKPSPPPSPCSSMRENTQTLCGHTPSSTTFTIASALYNAQSDTTEKQVHIPYGHTHLPDNPVWESDTMVPLLDRTTVRMAYKHKSLATYESTRQPLQSKILFAAEAAPKQLAVLILAPPTPPSTAEERGQIGTAGE